MKDQELLIKKIDFVISELCFSLNYSNNRAANHFVSLRTRILNNQKLTKKMKENISWIEKSVKVQNE